MDAGLDARLDASAFHHNVEASRHIEALQDSRCGFLASLKTFLDVCRPALTRQRHAFRRPSVFHRKLHPLRNHIDDGDL